MSEKVENIIIAMNRIILTLVLINGYLINDTLAQVEESPKDLIQHFEELSQKWHELEPGLEDYEGFKRYCVNKEYKNTIDEVFYKIHHYDSIILSKVNNPAYEMDRKERNKILKEIRKFESKYSTQEFLKTLKRECHERHEIEHDKKLTRNDFADNSYSGQIIILESELFKYSRQITRKIDHINKYLHHLQLHEILD